MPIYENIKGTIRPSFKLSPNGVEIISKEITANNDPRTVEFVKTLYLKHNVNNQNVESRVLTEYDIDIPNIALLRYSDEGSYILLYLKNGVTLRLPKNIENINVVGDVVGPNGSVAGNVALFADNTGKALDDRGYGVRDSINLENDSEEQLLSEKSLLSTAAAVGYVGYPSQALKSRLLGMLPQDFIEGSEEESN